MSPVLDTEGRELIRKLGWFESRDQPQADAVSRVLERRLAGVAAEHIATHLRFCEMPPELQTQGRDLVRRLARVAGIEQEMEAKLGDL
jgi:hypothetical protein